MVRVADQIEVESFTFEYGLSRAGTSSSPQKKKWTRTAIAARAQAMASQHDVGADAHLKGTLIANPESTDNRIFQQKPLKIMKIRIFKTLAPILLIANRYYQYSFP